MLIGLKLAKIWNVTPSVALQEKTDVVLGALLYEKFLNQYESKSIDIAREHK